MLTFLVRLAGQPFRDERQLLSNQNEQRCCSISGGCNRFSGGRNRFNGGATGSVALK